MESIGPHIASQDPKSIKAEKGKAPFDTERMSQAVNYLIGFKPDVSNRVRFMILGLEDLRNKKWEKKNAGPKTKDEIKREVMKEEEENKRDREIFAAQEFQEVNKKARGGGTRQSHESRRSSENKRARLGKAFCASSQTNKGSSTRKNASLSQVFSKFTL